MAAVATTAAQVGLVFPNSPSTRVRNFVAAEALTAGWPVYQTSAGKAGKADATSAGKEQFRGVALSTVGAGDTVSVCEEGEVYGFGLSGVAYDGLVYLDTAGAYADAANGTKTVAIGRVKALTDLGSLTKVLYVQSRVTINW